MTDESRQCPVCGNPLHEGESLVDWHGTRACARCCERMQSLTARVQGEVGAVPAPRPQTPRDPEATGLVRAGDLISKLLFILGWIGVIGGALGVVVGLGLLLVEPEVGVFLAFNATIGGLLSYIAVRISNYPRDFSRLFVRLTWAAESAASAMERTDPSRRPPG